MNPRIKYIVDLYNTSEWLALKALDEAKPETLNVRPDDKANSFAWVFGHIVATRVGLANSLGIKDKYEWTKLYEYGVEIQEVGFYPSIEELKQALAEISVKLKTRFEELTDDDLGGEPPLKIPGIEESLGGSLSFLSLHESYHVGQLAYIQRLHGGEKLVG